MNKEYFNKRTTAQLQSNYTMIKVVAVALSIILLLLISVSLYGLVAKNNNTVFIALLVVGISCGGILPLQFGTMKKIKEEIKLRENQK